MADPTTRRVTCSECGKRSDIMQPDPDLPGDVVWKCPAPLDNGIDMCGATNTTAV
jgi:hypothetical protein